MGSFRSQPDHTPSNPARGTHVPHEEHRTRAFGWRAGRDDAPAGVSAVTVDGDNTKASVGRPDKSDVGGRSSHVEDAQPEQPLAATLYTLGAHILELRESIGRLASAMAAQNELAPALASLSDRCAHFTERSYEREYLQPIFSALIDIVARRSNLADRMKALAELPAIANQPEIALHLRMLADVNTADRVDIENLLASLGVEAYQTESDRFDPSAQQAKGSIETGDASLHGRIAERLCPGYRRHGEIIRHERVRIYRLVTSKA
jgi:hypothetical protein